MRLLTLFANGEYKVDRRFLHVSHQVELAVFVGAVKSALRVMFSTLRHLVEPRERRLEIDRQAELAVLVGISEPALRPSVSTMCRHNTQGPSPSLVGGLGLERLRCFELRGPSKDECAIGLGCEAYSQHPSAEVCRGRTMQTHATCYLVIGPSRGVYSISVFRRVLGSADPNNKS